MNKLQDLSGKRFGRLKVLYKTGETKYGKALWRCKCDCGNYKDTISMSLKNGDVQSCGCLQKETRQSNALKIKHKKHGMADSRLYRIYHDMVSRCYRKSINGYGNYGGRGIRVCEEWLGEEGFMNFMKWSLDNGYNDEVTIDRLDSNGNYEPRNCRWATHKEQANNTRSTIFLEYSGKRKSLSEWAEITGISKRAIYGRIRKGWSVGKALGFE